MKTLLLLTSLAMLSSSAQAAEVTVGVSGGAMWKDSLEVLGDSWYATPKVGYWFNDTLALELDLGVMTGKTRIQELNYFGFTPRVNLLGKMWVDQPINLTMGGGIGGFYKSTSGGEVLGPDYVVNDFDFLFNAGPGLMLPMGNLHLRTDVRWPLSFGTENFRNRGDQFINWEWTAGVGLSFGGPKDEDKDGVVDEEDACPSEPEDADGFEDEDGCPEADNDKDGIADVDDQCANQAEDMDEFEDTDGCPEADNDDDGILDGDDQCPNEAGNESGKGCPDGDEDTVVDAQDECPEEAGSVDAFGCPDGDKDRVPDHRDECPEIPANEGIDPLRSNGCASRVFFTAKALKITDKIFFATGKATIQKKSNELLDEIAAALNKYKGVTKVQIEGHTDSDGDDDKNMTLSQARAEAVMEYLTTKGEVNADRLVAKGFGETKPVAENDSDENKAKNRRVEFNILEQTTPGERMQGMLKQGGAMKMKAGEGSAEEAAEGEKAEDGGAKLKTEEKAEEPKAEEKAEEKKAE